MSDVPEDTLFQGLRIDIAFGEPRPSFGDLFRICGGTHPLFPPTGEFGLERLVDLQFEQVDDYFGVRSLINEGTDVPVSLYPLVGGEPVYHHIGPFDGVRLEYSILRNPACRAEHFLRCVEEFAALASGVFYRNRGIMLGTPPNLGLLRDDITAVVQHWASEGVIVGSDEALGVDY